MQNKAIREEFLMSLTVSGQSQNLYNAYTFTNTDTYKKNVIDSSSVSKENYNVSNLTNALDALSNTDSVDTSSIGNISSYVQSAYKLSQLDSYESLSSSSSSGISRMLSGKAGADDIYALIGAENEISADTIISSISGTSSSATSNYSNYLSESGSILNLLV